VGQVPDEPEQDHLRDVLGIGILKLPPQAPGVDLRAVAVNERRPGRLVAWVVLQGHQDAHARAAADHLDHDPTLRKRDPMPLVPAARSSRAARVMFPSRIHSSTTAGLHSVMQWTYQTRDDPS